MIARTTSFIKNCLIGMTVLVALLAAGRFWIATVFGLLASFFWYPGVIFSRPAAVMLGIMGYLAIPAPFIPLIIRHPYWAGIPVCVLMLIWHAVCRVWGKKLGVAMQKDRVVLEGLAWAGLLRKWPRLEEWCDWSTLDGWSWAHLLAGQPQFADKCEQFADKCDWSELSGTEWSGLLSGHPQFADKCDWQRLEGGNWADLLAIQPQFADRCDWQKLNGGCWVRLLADQPQFADKCDWIKLDDENWGQLLEEQPQFADKRGK